jgi:hypothetical protein
MGVAEDHGIGAREAASEALGTPLRGTRVVNDPHGDAAELQLKPRRQNRAYGRLVHIAVNGMDRRAEAAQQFEHRERHEIASMHDRRGSAAELEAAVGQRAVAARQVRVADDRELH